MILNQPMVDGSHEETRIAEWWRSGRQNLMEDSTAFDELLIKLSYNGRKIHGIYMLRHNSTEAVIGFYQHIFATLPRLVIHLHSMNTLKN